MVKSPLKSSTHTGKSQPLSFSNAPFQSRQDFQLRRRAQAGSQLPTATFQPKVSESSPWTKLGLTMVYYDLPWFTMGLTIPSAPNTL